MRFSDLDDLLDYRDGVLDTSSALKFLTPAGLRWRVRSGRWQKPCKGVVVAQSGPLTERQILWIAILWAGHGAVLGGLTGATLDGLKGFGDREPFLNRPVHILVPASRPTRRADPPFRLVIHYSRLLGPDDVHPVRQPPRTRIARSLVDAAAWMATDRGAQAVLAAGVQQRLVRVEDLTKVFARNPRLRRRQLIKDALDDIGGGAHALSELDFTRLVVRRFRLPEPDRQAARRDSRGRRRWLDAVWEGAKVIAEVDGAAHMDALEHWDDMSRDNDLRRGGYQVLRFPAFMVRYQPEEVADTIRGALREAGCAC